MQLTVTGIQEWLKEYAVAIDQQKDYLSGLDTPIGDGDHGNNMARGMSEYLSAFEKQQPETISDTLKLFSMTLISKVGGASGPLYGSAFLNMTKASNGLSTIDSYEQLGEIVEQGLQGIQQRGKAVVGEKTMIDVWDPVATALKNGSLDKTHIEEAKENTKDLVAKKGRASYLGERSVGHIDPGAASSALLFELLADQLKKSIDS